MYLRLYSLSLFFVLLSFCREKLAAEVFLSELWCSILQEAPPCLAVLLIKTHLVQAQLPWVADASAERCAYDITAVARVASFPFNQCFVHQNALVPQFYWPATFHVGLYHLPTTSLSAFLQLYHLPVEALNLSVLFSRWRVIHYCVDDRI